MGKFFRKAQVINRIYILLLFLLLNPLLSNDNSSELDTYFDLYDKIFETFTSNYVDTLDKTQLIKGSLDGMFKSVDPYTKLYIGSSKDNLEILTKGKYGGIGMQIGLIRDTLNSILSTTVTSQVFSTQNCVCYRIITCSIRSITGENN